MTRYRADRTAEDGRELVEGQFSVNPEHDDFAAAFVELREGFAQFFGRLFGRIPRGWRGRGEKGERRRGRFGPLPLSKSGVVGGAVSQASEDEGAWDRRIGVLGDQAGQHILDQVHSLVDRTRERGGVGDEGAAVLDVETAPPALLARVARHVHLRGITEYDEGHGRFYAAHVRKMAHRVRYPGHDVGSRSGRWARAPSFV